MNYSHPLKSNRLNLRAIFVLCSLLTLLTACQQGSHKKNRDLLPKNSITTPVTTPLKPKSPEKSETPSTITSPRLIAYYNANTKPILHNAERLQYTHYILSFLIPDGKGGIKPSGALKVVLADKDALARVQAAGKKIVVSVGGGTVTGKDWLKMGNNAQAIVESIATIVEQYNLDGVDLDVEAVPYTKQSSFQPYADAVITLTQALAKRLPNKYLSHAPQPP